MFGCPREAVRVKVKKCETRHQPEYRKFSVDPQITSIEVLQSILIKAFDIKGEFTVSYRAIDDYGSETYLFLLSDWDLDAAFISASEPYLYLQVNLKPFGETGDCECYWEQNAQEVSTRQQETGFPYKTPKLPGLIMNKLSGVSNFAFNLSSQMERTLNMVQRALGNLGDESSQSQSHQQNVQPPRPPLTDAEFRRFLDPIGQVVHSKELRAVIYFGGIEPSLRKVVWKHILNVYPEGMSGRERMDYMKKKAQEYQTLRERWRMLVQKGQNIGDLGYVTGMVRKDVLRTDRHHKFYGGSDDNQNTASLFNILTTYALNHPSVSYCQGMSDLASPLLVTMRDEAQAYICLCALMRRLKDNFMLDGIAMTTKFAHLAEGLQHYDPDFYAYLKLHQADDLLFCYRWLLLEMKREFALDDALRMLEVLWAALPASPPTGELSLAEVPFPPASPPPSPNVKHIRENAYTKVCAIRRQSSSASIAASVRRKAFSTEEPILQSSVEVNGETKRSNSPYETFSDSENDLTSTKNRRNNESTEKCLSTDSLPVKSKRANLLELKERLSSPNKEQTKNSEQNDNSGEKKCARVVKNLNEFLNFTSLNRSKVTPSDAEPELRRVSSESGVIRVLRDEPSSPDDPTDFFPMTTSMTRELRLELESLDRQVFGPSPPSELQCDCVLSKREGDLPESETETELARCSPATDVFVWENPLHTLQQKHHPTTPDEQAELEYDGEILEDQNGVKSVTPIRLLKRTTRSESASDSEGTESWHQTTPVPESPMKQQQQQQSVQEQCEEATELINLIPAGTSEDQLGENSLPPPHEFGGGNPFLMFLCITLLLQHRDFVMRNQMDYNEMAMHFDKMVRRHNVIRVLNQARQLFAGYLRRHSVALSSSANSTSTSKPDCVNV
ncbi:TBC1 domain family member 25 isoform X1 [Solenopsis invicta]|uniref:TBC1 domain family member 25 isoform X1 n=1 Tax=Solenopsis invicta TaxID=13686 RepID=UPI000595DDFB|nr:TBC1 domain family member 25 isoform X1 [Solenopsis invicta]XP_025987385.1 TBC1 domain family member 25 isoform X1 [Solenopsis invicta]XP_039310163.1 TBC1 domain family member 25 isoform X1 [Solenopsis invicta]